jgi:hypothetical protein
LRKGDHKARGVFSIDGIVSVNRPVSALHSTLFGELHWRVAVPLNLIINTNDKYGYKVPYGGSAVTLKLTKEVLAGM